MASDLIERAILLDIVENKYRDIVAGRYPFNIVAYDLSEIIKKQPTVDAVEVVRCKDCRHKDFRYYDKESVFCYMSAKYRHINDFCSYGAKMDGGEEE